METLYFILVGAIAFAIFAVGVALTFATYIVPIEDGNEELIAIRLFLPPVLFLAVLIFYGFFGILTLFDDSFSHAQHPFWDIFASLVGLGIVFSLKNVIAPAILGATAAWAVYKLMMYGGWELFPIYWLILEGLLFWAPDWIQIGYIYGSIAALIASTVGAFAS